MRNPLFNGHAWHRHQQHEQVSFIERGEGDQEIQPKSKKSEARIRLPLCLEMMINTNTGVALKAASAPSLRVKKGVIISAGVGT